MSIPSRRSSIACAVAVALALAAAACQEPSAPASHLQAPPGPAATISDGAHGGSPRLYFLPPLVPPPTYSGTFDPTAFAAGSTDAVYVCQWVNNACAAQLVSFGPGAVQVDLTNQVYYVNWPTAAANLDTANAYRLLVRVRGRVVGWADLAPITNGGARKNIDLTQFIPVLIGGVLPIHFRLETVPNQPPVAHFTVSCTSLVCSFDGSSSTDDVAVMSWSWDFGDGTGDVGVTPTHTYAAAGTYTVRLTVTDGGGLTDTSSQQVTVTAPATGMIGVTAGGSYTCSVSATGYLYCWGRFPDPASPTSTPTLEVQGLQDWVRIGVGEGSASHACAFDVSGLASCWGTDNVGQLGDGVTTTFDATPRVVNGPNFSTITMGNGHTCGLTADGSAYCWGWNANGQLGDSTTTDRSVPTPVAGGLTFVSISAGAFHTCGVTRTGAAYCWGSNQHGQLGSSTANVPAQTTPTPVSGGLVFASVAAGGMVTCGVTATGQGYCWGNSFYGQLGNGSFGTTPDQYAPAAVSGGLSFSRMAVGFDQVCALTTAGIAYCWGLNTYGQLGNGQNAPTFNPTPGPVSAGFSFTQISAGYEHTCGIALGGSLYCWGYNASGELGDGTTANRVLPTLVTFP